MSTVGHPKLRISRQISQAEECLPPRLLTFGLPPSFPITLAFHVLAFGSASSGAGFPCTCRRPAASSYIVLRSPLWAFRPHCLAPPRFDSALEFRLFPAQYLRELVHSQQPSEFRRLLYAARWGTAVSQRESKIFRPSICGHTRACTSHDQGRTPGRQETFPWLGQSIFGSTVGVSQCFRETCPSFLHLFHS